MNRFFGRPLGLAALALAALSGLPTTAGAAPERPNVLFLFTDDQRADALGALGHPVLQTPNLDQLVRTGFVFHNAYCLGSNLPAVCTPSRNMLLSGRAYFRWKGPLAPADRPNFPTSLHDAGYLTYHHGKRGNTALAIQERFDTNLYVNEHKERTSGQPGKAIVDRAIQFLRDYNDDRPFFMYLAFEAPHDPRVAAKEYLDRYQRDRIPLPKNYRPLHPFDNGELTVRDEQLAPWPRTEAEIRRHLHEYYAVLTGLDHHIGRLLQTLRDLGRYERTLIIFSSDHGLALGSHGLMGKQNLYEVGMRAPLVFAGPGIPHGRSDALVYLLDIYPTVCDLVGAPVPAGLDGKSLAPVLRGQANGVRDSLFTTYRDVQRAVRDDRWKLIRYPHIDKTQLFDLKDDPDELHDLAGDPAQTGRIVQLTGRLCDWQRQLGDTAAWTWAKPRDPKFVPPTAEELAKQKGPGKK
jgi:arylsulfatase A-like enzyme